MRKFYKDALAVRSDQGWQVQLDGRGVRTVGGAPQVVPGAALAAALAAEWAGQGEEIDPARFVLRDLADHALDIVRPDPDTAIAALLRFAETDTLCYRAEPEDALARRQADLWDPLLHWAETRWDVHFERIAGVLHRPQPAATLERLRAVLAAQDVFTLAALNTLASLAASLIIALAALEPDADPATLWSAANLEEDWQAELWGQDAEALALRARRATLFARAAEFARLARG